MEEILDYILAPYEEYSWLDIALEMTGVFFGLLSVYFSKQENILVYPTGIISTAIFVYILFHAGLFGDMSINAYYFAMSIYGWYYWLHPKDDGEVPPITWASKRENLIGIGILLVAFGLVYYVLLNFTSSNVPLIDSITTAIFFVGMWFMARKNIENWIYWIIGDLISVPLYLYKGLGLTSFQYVVFTGLAIAGYLSWRKKEAEGRLNQLIGEGSSE